MDLRAPSPTISLGKRPTAATGSKKPPTYTTVGSIYNPKAATPLQPPTRRGRTLRYDSFRSPTDTSVGLGTPRPLSTLSMQGGTRGSPRDRTNLQHYTPLKQNYDRAVSPAALRERELFSRQQSRPPALRDEHAQTGTYSVGRASRIKSSHKAVSFDRANGDADAALPDDTLTSRFNVKGLTNLASFPNPMQKKAQKALAKGRSSNLEYTEPPYPPRRVTFALDEPDSSDSSAAARPDPPVSRGPPTPAYHGDLEDIYPDEAVSGGTARPKEFDASFAGLGAPRPLTAGPPGRRHYRPRASQATAKPPPYQSYKPLSRSPRELGDYRPGTASVLDVPASYAQTAGPHFDNWRNSRPSLSPPQRRRVHADENLKNIGALDSEPIPKEDHSRGALGRIPRAFHTNVSDTLAPVYVEHYYPLGMPSDYSGPPYHAPPAGWDQESLLPCRTGFLPSAEELKARQIKTDTAFYAGTEYFGKSMDETVQYFQHKDGEEPVWQRYGSKLSNGKTIYPTITVQDVNRQGGPENAAPLLGLALATLLSYAKPSSEEEIGRGWRSSFVTPDAHLIDNTAAGKKSLFTTGDAEKLAWRRKKGY